MIEPGTRLRERPPGRHGLLLCLLGAALGGGCHTFKLLPPVAERPEKVEREVAQPGPQKRSLRVSQFVFLYDFDLRRDQPLFQELGDMREQICRELQLPPTNTVIQVHLFEDRERYERFMQAKYPDLPKRRAFFVAQPRAVGGAEDLMVYTFWGERIREDLRHELTHAILHSVLKDVPLWLDEGLAEYFELPTDRRGINAHHLDQIRVGEPGQLKPDLNRLEQLHEVQQMTPSEYRESWAWVHLMLHGKPEARAVLVQYLQQLRVSPNAGPLEPRLTAVYPDLADTLTRHLAELKNAPPTGATVRR